MFLLIKAMYSHTQAVRTGEESDPSQRQMKRKAQGNIKKSKRLQAKGQKFTNRSIKLFKPKNKSSRTTEQNYFQGLKIYFQGLIIYFQALVINFQGLKIIFMRGV